MDLYVYLRDEEGHKVEDTDRGTGNVRKYRFWDEHKVVGTVSEEGKASVDKNFYMLEWSIKVREFTKTLSKNVAALERLGLMNAYDGTSSRIVCKEMSVAIGSVIRVSEVGAERCVLTNLFRQQRSCCTGMGRGGWTRSIEYHEAQTS